MFRQVLFNSSKLLKKFIPKSNGLDKIRDIKEMVKTKTNNFDQDKMGKYYENYVKTVAVGSAFFWVFFEC